jgi:hypothetical protein
VAESKRRWHLGFLGLFCVGDGQNCAARCRITVQPWTLEESHFRFEGVGSTCSPFLPSSLRVAHMCSVAVCIPKRMCQDGETQDVSLEQIRLGPSEPSKATFTKKQQVEARDKDTWFVPLNFASLPSSPGIFLLSLWRCKALPPLELYRSPQRMFALGTCHRTHPFSAQFSAIVDCRLACGGHLCWF